MSEYPRFATYIHKTGKQPYQWAETGAVLLKTESEREFLVSIGYEFTNWEADGRRSAEILQFPKSP